MKANQIIVGLIFLMFNLSCSKKKETNNTALKTQIDAYVNQTMQSNMIPGIAIAIIREDEVIYKNYFGKASLETDSIVNKNTLFRIFSTTKLITSTGVFQLIEDGKLNLEDDISKYIDNIPQQWQQVKIKNLVSHSSGIPDMIRYESTLTDTELMEKLANTEMDFVTGNQFRYNQTNFWLLAQIIEKITKIPFDDFILKNQFTKASEGVLFSSNSKTIIPNRATRYFYNSKTKSFDKDTNNNGERGHSGNGVNITLDAFIAWNKRLDDNQLLNTESKLKMWKPFNFTNQKDVFLHGWGSYSVNELKSYGFTGGNLSAFRKFVDSKTTIILLSNGYKIPIYDIMVNDIARMVIPQFQSKDFTLEKEVMDFVKENNFNKAKVAFKKLKNENPKAKFENLNSNINSIGNTFVRANKIAEAYQIFNFNAEINPNWWIALAGLATVQEQQGDKEAALRNYHKAIVLNEQNEYRYNEIMRKKISEIQK